MSFYMRILNRTEKNRRFLFLAAVFAVCTAAMLTVLMMPQKQVVCKGEADFKQFGLQSGKAVDLCGEWEFFEQKFIATELDEEQVFGKVCQGAFLYAPEKCRDVQLGKLPCKTEKLSAAV